MTHPLHRAILTGLLGFIGLTTAYAQPTSPDYNRIFDDSRIASVFIEISTSDLDRLFGNTSSDVERVARFIYDDGSMRTVIDSVGFRLRGNTSRAARKKSFKVSFNSFIRGQRFEGLEKLNLNGEHNDPTLIRSKLSWDIFGAMGVPSSRANHVRLYINDTYYGLYANIEHIDEHFLESRFGSSDGFLYKCLWPANLAYLGDDPTLYHPRTSERRPYDLKLRDSDDEGYHDLAHFIDVLNNTPDADFEAAVEEVFEVNGFLKWMAVNVIVGMWDDYWFNQNNYYLYSDPRTGRFHFIPFDYDNTFGIDWFGIDWAERNVYTFGEPSLNRGDRPLARRILSVPAYRDRYSFYLRQVLDGPFNTLTLMNRIEALRTQITPAAEADPFRSLDYQWNMNDFHRAFNSALGAHVTYGLIPYITTRSSAAKDQLETVDIPPILSYLNHTFADNQLVFSLLVEDEQSPTTVTLHLTPADSSPITFPLHDDGLHGDQAANDGIYGMLLSDTPTRFSYWVTATDVAGQTSQSRTLRVDLAGAAGPLVINELMADNTQTLADPSGAFDDWVELYNAGSTPVSLLGLSLSDNPNEPSRWLLPDVTIAPGAYLVLWTDGDAHEGPLHGPFRLSRNGETLGLYQRDGSSFTLLDRVVFGPQDPDVSFGRSPDGSTTLGTLQQPTPGTANRSIATSREIREAPQDQSILSVYPNPFAEQATIQLTLPHASEVHLNVYDLLGRRVARLIQDTYAAGTYHITWDGLDADGQSLPPGVYLVQGMIHTPTSTAQISTSVVRVR